MASPVLVDTDVLIDYFSGVNPSAEAVAGLIEEDRLAITSLTLFELACGAQTPDELHDLELLTQAAHLVGLDGPAALRAGAIYRELKKRGQLLEPIHILIAGCCLASGLPFLTRNIGHFRRIPGLVLLQPEEILKGCAL